MTDDKHFLMKNIGTLVTMNQDREIKTDAWVAPGHSGGPLVDRHGELVGIAAATLGTTESLGMAIPVSRLPDPWRARIAEQIAGARSSEDEEEEDD